MINVVLPVLDEVAAIPSVLAGLPDEFVPIIVDNGSTDGSGDVARELGVHVVYEARRGFGAACFTGLRAATTDVVCFMDCDGSFRGSDLARVVAPVLRREADLVLGAREPSDRGAWPWHARMGNRAITFEVRRRTGLAFARPRADARRASHQPARARDRGPAIRMAARDGVAGVTRRLARTGNPGCLRPAHRPLEGHGHDSWHGACRPRHVGGTSMTVAAMTGNSTVIVIAKQPVPGRVKTRLCPPFLPEDAASLAAAAIHDTCAAIATSRCTRRIVALDGAPGPWLRGDFEVIPQPEGSLDVRLASAFDHAAGPTVIIGMDTPQITAHDIDSALSARYEAAPTRSWARHSTVGTG